MHKELSNKVIFLVRHAEVYNPNKIVYARLPRFNLSKVGLFQAERLKKFFKKENINTIYSSPLLRARKTAQIIADGKIIKISKYFNEINFVKWQGLKYNQKIINEIRQYTRHPQKTNYFGESLEEAQERMIIGLKRLAKKEKGRKIVIVSHADPIILTVLYFLKKPTNQLDNTPCQHASIYKLIFNKKGECEKIKYIQIVPTQKDWP